MPEVRLVKGPHGGKKVNVNSFYGGNEVILRAPKKMTHKQKWEWQMQSSPMIRAYPTVEARYRLAYAAPGVPCMHPDGTYFYVYVEGSKKEF